LLFVVVLVPMTQNKGRALGITLGSAALLQAYVPSLLVYLAARSDGVYGRRLNARLHADRRASAAPGSR